MATILSNNGKGVRLEVSGTSTRARIVGTGDSLVLSNGERFDVYVALGTSTIEADLTSYLVLPGTKEDNIVLDPETHREFWDDPWIAAICAPGQSGVLTVHRVSR